MQAAESDPSGFSRITSKTDLTVLNWSELSNTWKIWKALKIFQAFSSSAKGCHSWFARGFFVIFVPGYYGYYGYAVGSHLIQSVYHPRQSVEHRSEKRWKAPGPRGFSTKWTVSAESRKTSSNEGPKNNNLCAQKDFKKNKKTWCFKSIHAGKWTNLGSESQDGATAAC